MNTDNYAPDDVQRPYGGTRGAMAAATGQEQGETPRRYTPLEAAEHEESHHRTEAAKARRAVRFYRDHPEFDEFIQLVRAGAIQI